MLKYIVMFLAAGLVACGDDGELVGPPVHFVDGSTDGVTPMACSTTRQRACVNGQSCQFGDDCLFGSNCLNNICTVPGGNNNSSVGNNQPARSFSAASDSSLGYYKTGPGLDTSTAQSLGRVCIAGGEWINQNVGTATATTLAGNYVGVIACRRGNLSDCNPSRERPTLDLSFWGTNPLSQPGCRVEPNCQGIPYVLCY